MEYPVHPSRNDRSLQPKLNVGSHPSLSSPNLTQPQQRSVSLCTSMFSLRQSLAELLTARPSWEGRRLHPPPQPQPGITLNFFTNSTLQYYKQHITVEPTESIKVELP